jgi:hypothetical protein
LTSENQNPLALALQEEIEVIKPQTITRSLNEITVIIMFPNMAVNFHKTFMVDTRINNTFSFDGQNYIIPAQKAYHYFPSFWDFPRKWAAWFSRHRTWAFFLDVFKLAKNSSRELGFLYVKGQANPIDLDEFKQQHDWALDNYNLRRNRSIAGHYAAVTRKLKGQRDFMSSLGWIVILIIGVVAIISVIAFISANPGLLHQAAQNATVTPAPIIGGP